MKEYINGGDVLYCDLSTQEYWVKTVIKIHSGLSKLTISLDIKFKLETYIKKLKFLLIKLGINFWVDFSKGQHDSFHYIFTNARFRTLKSKNNIDFNVNDINKSLLIEQKKVKDICDFHSEIQCNINLISLEELLQQELKNYSIDPNSQNKLRWNEFKELSFDMLNREKKFMIEKDFIKKYIRRFIKPNPSYFYLYDKFAHKCLNEANLDEDELLFSEDHTQTASLLITPHYDEQSCHEKKIRADSGDSNREVSRQSKDENLDKDNFKKVNSNTDTNLCILNINVRDVKQSLIEKEIVKLKIDNLDRVKSQEIDDECNVKSRNEDISSTDEKSMKDEEEIMTEVSRKNSKLCSFLDKSRSCHGLMEDPVRTTTGRISIPEGKPEQEKRNSIDDSALILGRKRNSTRKTKSIHDLPSVRDDQNTHEHQPPEVGDIQTNPDNMKQKYFEPNKKYYSKRNNCQSHQKLSNIFSKMRDTSKYSNLCTDFKSYLKSHNFIDVVEGTTALKLARNTLERVFMPQFRDLKVESEGVDTEVKNSTTAKNDDDEPIRVNNRKILLFIGGLFLVFITTILFIFLCI